MKKPILDIIDIQSEFDKLNQNLKILNDRFMAIAMDYQHYIDNSWGQEQIYQLRDNIQYRLFSARFHIELLLRHHGLLEHRFNEEIKSGNKEVIGQYFPVNPYFKLAQEEISSLFDSFLYHIVSMFDYLGTLVNYVCGPSGTKQDTLMWTKLANASRDLKSHFGSKPIAIIIKEQDNVFVGKLYDYRSFLIHKKADFNYYNFSLQLGGDDHNKLKVRFIASPKFIKQFAQLKTLAETNDLTTKYVSFWLVSSAIKSITSILFGLKKEMELNPKVPFGLFGIYDKETRTMGPVSKPYWHSEP